MKLPSLLKQLRQERLLVWACRHPVSVLLLLLDDGHEPTTSAVYRLYEWFQPDKQGGDLPFLRLLVQWKAPNYPRSLWLYQGWRTRRAMSFQVLGLYVTYYKKQVV